MQSFRMCSLYYLAHPISDFLRWFHVKVCAVAGVGFFTDAYVNHAFITRARILIFFLDLSYDIFAINIGATMIGYVYGKGMLCLTLSSPPAL